MKIAICEKCGDARWADRMHPVVPNYCRPCGENLLPEQMECPFCGKPATAIDALTELVHELRYVESVYRQNCVERGEPSSVLEGMQKLLAKHEAVK